MRPTPPTTSPTRLARWAVLSAAAALSLGACMTEREPFPGEDPGRLWNAMIAAAVTPDYAEPDPRKAWQLKENHVWVDGEQSRLEVYRELVRDTKPTSARPLLVQRNSRYQIRLEQLEEEPQTISFVSRGAGAPKHRRIEALRYFNDVRTILGLAFVFGSDQSGALTPEAAAREMVRAMFMQDEGTIRRLVLPVPDMEVLWEAGTEDIVRPEDQDRLQMRAYRPALLGEIVMIEGDPVKVTPDMVTDDRRLMLGNVFGEELAPFYVVKLGDRWWVSAEPIIERRRVEIQRRRWEEEY